MKRGLVPILRAALFHIVPRSVQLTAGGRISARPPRQRFDEFLLLAARVNG
jgi:hypothetical protein